jgi:nucleoside-diphosphate-sugar epimerase
VTELLSDVHPDAVVHIASITNPVALQKNPFAALRVNVEGTFNVLEASRQLGVGRVIYFSSIGALPKVQYEPIDAAHPTILPSEGPGSSFYGASKLASEAFALAYHSTFGLDVRIVRPSAVYGLGMNWPIYIKPMVEGAVRGEAVSFNSGGPFPRDYTHVSDVASLVVALLDAPDTADRVFYAATGEPLVTAAELANIVKEVVPGAKITIADRLSPEDMLELRYRGRISIASNTEQLGWEPRYRLLADGVRAYVERYREFLAAGDQPRPSAPAEAVTSS